MYLCMYVCLYVRTYVGYVCMTDKKCVRVFGKIKLFFHDIPSQCLPVTDWYAWYEFYSINCCHVPSDIIYHYFSYVYYFIHFILSSEKNIVFVINRVKGLNGAKKSFCYSNHSEQIHCFVLFLFFLTIETTTAACLLMKISCA